MRQGHIVGERSGVGFSLPTQNRPTLSNPGKCYSWSRNESWSLTGFISACGNVRREAVAVRVVIHPHKDRQRATGAPQFHILHGVSRLSKTNNVLGEQSLGSKSGSATVESSSLRGWVSVSQHPWTVRTARNEYRPSENLFSSWDGVKHRQGTSKKGNRAQRWLRN